MASIVSPLTGTQTTAPSTSSSSSGTTSPATPTEEMFLNLLVAQIKNQDPLNPTDSAQFVSQLTQITQLEQVIGIRGDIETYMGSKSGSSQTGTTANPTTTNPTTTNPTGN